jgi:HSP20 family molecular chaperone IbpA
MCGSFEDDVKETSFYYYYYYNFFLDFVDFLKEQLKITYVCSSRVVRVTGEKPLAYKRFDQTFPAPENCEVNKIQGMFQNGILFITIPKATNRQPHSEEEEKVTKEAS